MTNWNAIPADPGRLRPVFRYERTSSRIHRLYREPDEEILEAFSALKFTCKIDTLQIGVELIKPLVVLVVFCGTDEIRKQAMSTLLLQFSHDGSRPRIILVLQNKMNSHARKLAAESSFQIETFLITDLLVNITKHLLLPKHEILTPQEQQDLLKKLDVKPSQMPRILETDAIVKYYGLEKGQILKVTYEGPSSTGPFVTYRCVM